MILFRKMRTIRNDAENGHEHSCTSDVDISRRQCRDIVSKRICTSSDLISHCRDSHCKTSKELCISLGGGEKKTYHCGTAVELCNDSRHEPDIFTPEIFSSGSDKDWCQCTQSTEEGEEDELTVSGILIFGESTEIRHVDGKRGEEADDDVESREGRPRRIHACGEMDLAGDKRSAAMGYDGAKGLLERNTRERVPPEKQSEKSWRDDDRFEAEEISKSVHGQKRNTSLHHPVEEHHKECSTSDVCACWKGIREIVVRRPDSRDHVLEVSSALNCSNCCPLTLSRGNW